MSSSDLPRFLGRLLCGLIPSLVCLFLIRFSRSYQVFCLSGAPFEWFSSRLSELVCCLLCVLSTALLLSNVCLSVPEVFPLTGVLVICALASVVMRLPYLKVVYVITWALAMVVLVFAIMPYVTPREHMEQPPLPVTHMVRHRHMEGPRQQHTPIHVDAHTPATQQRPSFGCLSLPPCACVCVYECVCFS